MLELMRIVLRFDFRLQLIFWVVFFVEIPLLAVTVPPPPPAGIVERQIEQEYEAEMIESDKQAPILESEIPEKQFQADSGSVFVHRIIFSGNQVVPTEELEELAKPYEERELSLQDIRRFCEEIQAVYASKGYVLVRVYPPAQEVKDGVLTLQIVEGRLGEVSVIGNKFYSDKFVKKYFEKYRDRPINYHEFLRALLLLDENIDLHSGIVFRKGEKFGTADVVVRVQDKRPVHLTIDHNNYGSLLTSVQRTGVRLDWGSLFMYGDQLTLIEVLGSPMSSLDFTDAIYRIPVNAQGAAIELSYLFANFKAHRNSDGIRATGRSNIATLKFLQAFQRSRSVSSDFFAAFDYKKIVNFGNKMEASEDKLRVLSTGFSGDLLDGWSGRNILNGSAAFGIPHFLGAEGVKSSSGSREGAGGWFAHINGQYQRVQRLPWNMFLVINGVGQYGFNSLPLPEQIYIGGIDTVRGYKLAEGLGDSGFYANFELRVPPPFLRTHKVPWMKKTWGEFLQFVGFLDHGQTFTVGEEDVHQIVRAPSGVNEKEWVRLPGRAILTSAGVGVRVYGPWQFEFSLDVGYPLTSMLRSSTTIVYFRVALKAL